MKKYLSAFCVLALVMGCSKENIAPVQSSNEVLLTSYAGQPQTKTTIAGNKTDGFTANWAADDAIGVYTTAGTANAKHTITVLSDGTAKFTGKVAASENEQTLYAYYPYTSSATSNLAAALLNLPSVQTMTGASYDASAAIMVGKPQTATLDGESAEIGNWKFAHLGSYISISVADITAETVSTDELVSTVSIKSESKTLSGDFTLNLKNGQVAFSKTLDEVTVSVPDGTTLGNLEAWAVTFPFALADEALTITIVTNKNTIKKAVNLTKEFKAGNVYTLGIKIDENCAVKKALAFAKEYSVSERTCYWRGGTANKKVGVWNHTGEFSAGTYPENVSDLKSIRLLIKPVTRGGGMKPAEGLSKKIWINDVLVFDNKNNSGDVWRINTALGGLHYKYGILSAVGSIVIKSFDIDENYSNYND